LQKKSLFVHVDFFPGEVIGITISNIEDYDWKKNFGLIMVSIKKKAGADKAPAFFDSGQGI